MLPCYLVILESQPSLNNEGVDASSSSLTSCRNKEPGCVGSPARESAGGTTCHACRGKCLRVYPDPPACSHPPLHVKSARHTQAISEARTALVRGLYSLSRLAKDIGDKMRSSYGTELTFEDEDYPRKRVNIGTSFPWSEPFLWTELTGQLLEGEVQRSGGELRHRPQPAEGRACAGACAFHYRLPHCTARRLRRILVRLGWMAGKVERTRC